MDPVVYPVEIHAQNSPDAINKIRSNLRGLRIEEDISPISNKPHLLLGPSKPLKESQRSFMHHVQKINSQLAELKGKVEKRNTEVDELKGKFEKGNIEIDELKGKVEKGNTEIDELKGIVKDLEEDTRVLMEDRRSLVRRQLICCLYSVLGRPKTASWTGTRSWLTQNSPLLQTVFGASHKQIQQLLEVAKTEPSESFIETGNDAAYRFSTADATDAVRGQPEPLRWILNLLTVHSEADDIEVAAYEVQTYLQQRFPGLK